jgi:hypothetical protein
MNILISDQFDKGRLARGVLAWGGACLVAGFAMALVLAATRSADEAAQILELQPYEIVGLPFVVALGFSAFAAIYTALPAWGLLMMVRHFEIPRGWSDVVIGGIPGYIALIAFMVHASELRYLASSTPGYASFALMFLLPGWLAGFSYWLIAGRPRPPY